MSSLAWSGVSESFARSWQRGFRVTFGAPSAGIMRSIVFVDEDVPGGATAYMMQEVLETQGGYVWLDSEPRTVTGQPHRPAYGTDGDYFSKPNRETIFEAIYVLMRETDPGRFPEL